MWVYGYNLNVLNQNHLKWNSHLQIQNSRMWGEKGGGERHVYFAFIYGFEIIPWHLQLPIHTLLSKGGNHQPKVACRVTVYPLWWWH
jgi:hypothetical protein